MTDGRFQTAVSNYFRYVCAFPLEEDRRRSLGRHFPMLRPLPVVACLRPSDPSAPVVSGDGRKWADHIFLIGCGPSLPTPSLPPPFLESPRQRRSPSRLGNCIKWLELLIYPSDTHLYQFGPVADAGPSLRRSPPATRNSPIPLLTHLGVRPLSLADLFIAKIYTSLRLGAPVRL